MDAGIGDDMVAVGVVVVDCSWLDLMMKWRGDDDDESTA